LETNDWKPYTGKHRSKHPEPTIFSSLSVGINNFSKPNIFPVAIRSACFLLFHTSAKLQAGRVSNVFISSPSKLCPNRAQETNAGKETNLQHQHLCQNTCKTPLNKQIPPRSAAKAALLPHLLSWYRRRHPKPSTPETFLPQCWQNPPPHFHTIALLEVSHFGPNFQVKDFCVPQLSGKGLQIFRSISVPLPYAALPLAE